MSVGTVPVAAPRPLPPGPAPRPAGDRWWGRAVVLAAVALGGLWLWSLGDVRLADTAGWGLLDALPAAWFVAFGGILTVYAAALLTRRPVGHAPAACQVVLVALLFATTSAVYDAARYPWTFKHVGVVEYLLEHWSVDRSIDIYQNFPGFFYLAAALHEVTGVPVLDLARWAQPVLALITSAAVYWVVGGLTSSRRVRYGAVLVYTLGDWIGQNYFAPQALAFPLALFVVGGLLRSVPPGAAGLRPIRLRRRLPVGAADDAPRGSSFWRSGWGSAALVAGFAAVAVTHPLTPVVLLAQTALLALLLRPVRPWLPLVFLAVEALWLAQAWPFLDRNYDLFSFGLDNVEPPQVSVVDPLPGYTTALWAPPLLMALLAVLAVAAGLTAVLRRGYGGRMVAPLVLAAVPVVMVLGQPYGNEGIFRAYLFALPAMAYVIAQEALGARRRPGAGRRAVAAVVVAVLGVLALPANFVGELGNRVAASDVAADRWFEQHTPAGSVLLPFASPYPWRVTADYPDHLPVATEGVDGISNLPGFLAAARSASSLVAFTEQACASRPGTGPVYVALGPSAVDDVRLQGTMPVYTYRAFERTLAADPAFTPVFRSGESTLLRCRD